MSTLSEEGAAAAPGRKLKLNKKERCAIRLWQREWALAGLRSLDEDWDESTVREARISNLGDWATVVKRRNGWWLESSTDRPLRAGSLEDALEALGAWYRERVSGDE